MTSAVYEELVAARKACSVCAPHLQNASRIDSGRLDSDRIGPYSRWQGNLAAHVVVVAQDFSDVDAFQEFQGWPGERVPTNLALVELLAAAGLPVRAPRRGTPDDSLFFTNAVLCLKRGGMQAPVPAACFRACGRLFLRPTIDLVGPRAVAALGLASLNAVLAAYGLPTAFRLRELLTTGRTFELPNGARLFPFCHPGRRGQQARSMALQLSDWARLGEWLRSGPGGAAARGRPAEG